MSRGIDLLESRLGAIPRALRHTDAEEIHLAGDLAGAAGVVATGVGSSRAHARYLVHLLCEAGISARFLPTGAFATPPTASPRILVVFSQGLSPNALLPLEHTERWQRVIVVTAASERSTGKRGERFRELAARDLDVVRFAGEDEFGLLFRVVGPMCGYLAAVRLAVALAATNGRRTMPHPDVETIVSAVEAAPRRLPAIDAEALARPIAFLASGGYGELADNLALKVLEGWLRPRPPIWDLLEFAHGPFQQAFAERATFFVFARRGAVGEAELLARTRSMLDDARHRLLSLDAELPGPLAIFEHEAQLNEMLRRDLGGRDVDLTRWPGQGRDRALYDVERVGTEAEPSRGASELRPKADGSAHSDGLLERLTWPELERAIAAGKTTLVIPLGATEQHGPHLPFATDTWIAAELAARFCRRVPEAVAAAPLALGCSSEHHAFPGTLSLAPETLERVLVDLLAPLRDHGFARAFVFSAHGGNVAALRAMAPHLRAAAAPLEVVVFDELDSLFRHLRDASARFGVAAEASGHHAGEIETSILAALHPAHVRADRLESGYVEATDDPQSLFYPSLREHAPNGVVGDPRVADASRAETYLEAWVDRLVEAYRVTRR